MKMARLLGVTAAIVLPSSVLLFAVGAQTTDPAKVPDPARGDRILYPAPRSAHAGPVRLIVATETSTTPPTATLDGKPLPLTKMTFAASWLLPGKLKQTAARVGDRTTCTLWVARLTVTPGPHQVLVGGQQLPLLGVESLKSPVPPGWSVGSDHRLLPVAGQPQDCASCHEVIEHALGSVPTPKACAACHDETSVQLTHGHVPQPLDKCAMCHDPHGAALPKLLVDTKQHLCAKCHGSGHFRG